MRRYQAHNPYSHRTFFFLLAAFESLLKFAAAIAIVLGSYVYLKNKISVAEQSAAQQSREAPAVTVAAQPASEPNLDASAKGVTEPTSDASTTAQPAALQTDVQPIAVVSATDNSGEILNSQASVDWLSQLKPSDFVIQFAATPDKSAITAFANENMAATGAAIYPFKRTPSGRQVFGIATVASYDSLESARLALQSLPAALQQEKPWIRPVKDLQRQVLETL